MAEHRWGYQPWGIRCRPVEEASKQGADNKLQGRPLPTRAIRPEQGVFQGGPCQQRDLLPGNVLEMHLPGPPQTRRISPLGDG